MTNEQLDKYIDTIKNIQKEVLQGYKEIAQSNLQQFFDNKEILYSKTRLEEYLNNVPNIIKYKEILDSNNISKINKKLIEKLCVIDKTELSWVWYKNYKPLNETELDNWKNELKKVDSKYYIINQRAPYGEDDGYNIARQKFFSIYSDYPVLISKIKLRET